MKTRIFIIAILCIFISNTFADDEIVLQRFTIDSQEDLTHLFGNVDGNPFAIFSGFIGLIEKSGLICKEVIEYAICEKEIKYTKWRFIGVEGRVLCEIILDYELQKRLLVK